MMRLGLFCILSLILAARVHAHAVPSITLEAVFGADRSFELRANIDPRLIVSDKPTSLPPIESAWYRDQSPDQLKTTLANATAYLRHTVTLKFGDKEFPWPEPSYQPMDGATNLPMTTETKELHLLATVRGKAPEGDFQVGLNQDSNTSLVLLNSFNGKMERRPQVVFAAEVSRPFALPTKDQVVMEAPQVVRPSPPQAQAPTDYSKSAWVLVAIAALWGLRRMSRNFRSA